MSSNFWKESVLDWEATRYHKFYSKYFFRVLWHRREIALHILKSLPEGATIIELGCGSGEVVDLLGLNFFNERKISYVGVDISEAAISKARQKCTGFSSVQFIASEISEVKNLNADYVFSIGLMDWLTDQEYFNFKAHNFFKFEFHSYSSQKNTSVFSLAHVLFIRCIQFFFTAAYSPKKFSDEDIKTRFTTTHNIFRSKKLTFSAFIHNLPDQKFDINISSSENYFSHKKNKNIFEIYYKKKEMSQIKSYALNCKDKVVLEIGSGIGEYTELILNQSPQKLISIDPYVNTQKNIQNDRFVFLKTSLQNYEPIEKFDCIYVLGVTEFIPDFEVLLNRLIKSLKSDGTVFILAPDQSAWMIFNFYRMYHKFLNRIDLAVWDPLKIKLNMIGNLKVGPLNNLYEFKKS